MASGRRISVFPVVHVWSNTQAVDQTMLALDVGADGVYLIHHGGSANDLLEAYASVRGAVDEDAFVGVNILGCRSGFDAFSLLLDERDTAEIPELPDGLWVDDARPLMRETSDLRADNDPVASIRYLGGASFKYTSAYSDDPRSAVAEATAIAPHVDVVCTSGPGTGHPPPPEKISAMKAAIGTQPLAIASGVDHRNLDAYRSSVDEILVATSIETEPYSGVFDQTELRRLVEVAHGDEST